VACRWHRSSSFFYLFLLTSHVEHPLYRLYPHINTLPLTKSRSKHHRRHCGLVFPLFLLCDLQTCNDSQAHCAANDFPLFLSCSVSVSARPCPCPCPHPSSSPPPSSITTALFCPRYLLYHCHLLVPSTPKAIDNVDANALATMLLPFSSRILASQEHGPSHFPALFLTWGSLSNSNADAVSALHRLL